MQHHSGPPEEQADEIAVWRVQRKDGANEFAVVERNAVGASYRSEAGVAELIESRADPISVERAVSDMSFFIESEA